MNEDRRRIFSEEFRGYSVDFRLHDLPVTGSSNNLVPLKNLRHPLTPTTAETNRLLNVTRYVPVHYYMRSEEMNTVY